MKNIVIALIGTFMLCSCAVGSYSISSGKADEGMISFVSDVKTPIMVSIDNENYTIYTVKSKSWRKNRDIKTTAQNTLFLIPGQHNIVVVMNGKEIYSKKIFISTQEHKIIEL